MEPIEASKTTSPAPVPSTGQKRSYHENDDGDLQRGGVWPPERFTSDKGTVTDNLTGLIWLQNPNCAGEQTDWYRALFWIEHELNILGTMNGQPTDDTSNNGKPQKDWRLPNVKELGSLVDYGKSNPALPEDHPFSHSFETGTLIPFITSTSLFKNEGDGDSDKFFGINLYDGTTQRPSKNLTGYVWPVRGPETPQ